MQISVATRDYSYTAILTAIKKQQALASWRVVARNAENTVISFDVMAGQCTEDECKNLMQQALDDELLRERLEQDFGAVRQQLVEAALSPIIRASGL